MYVGRATIISLNLALLHLFALMWKKTSTTIMVGDDRGSQIPKTFLNPGLNRSGWHEICTSTSDEMNIVNKRKDMANTIDRAYVLEFEVENICRNMAQTCWSQK